MQRAIEIDIIVKIALGVLGKIVHPAHGDYALKQVGALQKYIHAVQCSKRGATYDDGSFLTGMCPNEWHDLLKNIVIPLLMPDRFMPRVHVVVHPTFPIDAVYGKDFDLSALDLRRNGIDQLKTLVFEIVGRCGGHQQQGKAIMAINRDRHLFLQGRTEPAGKPSFHGAV